MGIDFLRMKAMLLRRQPDLFACFRPPANRKQIEAAEQALGFGFPDELVQMYLCHDGCVDGLAIFLPFNRWCSLDEMVEKWRSREEIAASLVASGDFPELTPEDRLQDGEVMQVIWSPRWIPVGVSNTATSVFVDLSPAIRGVVGQLICDGCMAEGSRCSPSLGEYFQRLSDLLEQGFVYQREVWCLTANGQAMLSWHNMARELNRPDLLRAGDCP